MIDDYVGGYSPIEQENIELECQLDEVKEENEQLKQQLENEKQLNAEIKKRLIAVEYDSNDLLKKRYEENKQLAKRICELQSDLSKAKSMIDKMKCCKNCKHSYHDRYHTLQCIRNCINFDNWELAE